LVKLSVSKVARMLGVKRAQVQEQINNGRLHTHEGYVTTDSVRLAYPEFSISCEQDNHIDKINQIKKYADKKMFEHKVRCTENEKKLMTIIESLREEIRVLKIST